MKRLVALCALLLAGAASAQVVQPRLTTDKHALILLEEIDAPPDKRQPLVTLEVQPDLGSRHIRVAGRGLVPPAALGLGCGARTWTLARSEVRQVGDRTHAFFPVEADVGEAVLAAPACSLLLAGIRIPIPPDLVGAVWATK